MTYDSEPGLSDSPRGLLSPEKLILKMFIWISQRWVYTWTTRTKSTLLPSSDASVLERETVRLQSAKLMRAPKFYVHCPNDLRAVESSKFIINLGLNSRPGYSRNWDRIIMLIANNEKTSLQNIMLIANKMWWHTLRATNFMQSISGQIGPEECAVNTESYSLNR